MSSSGAMGKAGSRQTKRPTPLKMVKEEVRQYRPPVIIHTYSPKVIHVDAAQFSSLVQSLTGRGQKRKPEDSPKIREIVEGFSCASPSSSADSGLPGAAGGSHGLMSPRGPLASFEHLYHPAGFEASCAPLQSQTDQASNMLANAVLVAAASAGPQYSPLFTNHAFHGSFPFFSPLPSPNLLSPNFMADLPALSPSTYHSYEAFGSHSFIPSPGYSRFASSGMLPSPGSSSVFKDLPLMTSRD